MMELRGLSKFYDGIPAVSDFSLTIQDDEYVTLLGPSGSGKSTLLRLIAGLERADAGSVILDGKNLSNMPAHLRGLGFVQQKFGLFPHMSVSENIGFGLRNRQIDPITDNAELAHRVDRMTELVGLEGFGDRMVGEISGGQRQRVSLARTLICEPRICLLDEPLGALDANLRERMTVELRRIRKTLGVTFVHVTGNEAEALAMGDRMIVLDKGRAIQTDAPDTVFHQPACVRVAKFLNAYNIFSGRQKNGYFSARGSDFPVPAGIVDAHHCAIRYDKVSILAPDTGQPAGYGQIEAEFIASEFLGSRVIHFFRCPDGSVIEAQQHLSAMAPVALRQGESRTLCWPLTDVLFYGAQSELLEQERTLEVAQ